VISKPRHGATSCSAVTLARLLIVLAVVAGLALLAKPTITNALHKRELTRTMNHARELYLASFHMATDGAARSDPNLAWPGDLPATSLADYCGRLVQGGYLKPNDLQRILTAPGAECQIRSTGSPPSLTLTGKSALKLYKVKSSDPSTAIFAASSNYIYNTALSPASAPFGDKGFVVIRKRGDAGVYGRNQATISDWGNDAALFQSKIGRLTGATEGTVPSGDGATVLAGPE
jgi:type II secretory pathway pseudopilin PulG